MREHYGLPAATDKRYEQVHCFHIRDSPRVVHYNTTLTINSCHFYTYLSFISSTQETLTFHTRLPRLYFSYIIDTTIIKVLLEIAIKRGLKVAIVTEANSAADNVVEVIADKDYIAVRMHSMGKHLQRLW